MGALWVIARDIYWKGLQQATHVLKVVTAIAERDDLMLVLDDGRQFVVSHLGPDEAAIVSQFRRFAQRPETGYGPEAEQVQAEALEEFVSELDAEPGQPKT